MLRLAHRILSQRDNILVINGCNPKDASDCANDVESAVCFVVDNVAEYAWGKIAGGKSGSGFDYKSLGVVKPPFRKTFCEYIVPSCVREQTNFPIGSIGATFVVPTQGDREILQAAANEFASPNIIAVNVWGSSDSGRAFWCPVFVIVECDENWSVIKASVACMEKDKGMSQCGYWAYPCAMAIALLNCKNAHAVDETDRLGPGKKWERRQKVPEIRYKTLKIGSISKSSTPGETGDHRGDSIMSAHICRGHFSTYTEERPLFGKYSGKFWIPAHVRGSAKNGVVVKDYEVSGPLKA